MIDFFRKTIITEAKFLCVYVLKQKDDKTSSGYMFL